jgi:adenylate cyclase
MGDGVNVAARLEAANKTFGTTICISDSVVEAAGPDLVVRPLRKTRVKGREHEFMIYELLGLNGSNDPRDCGSWRGRQVERDDAERV